MQIRILSTLTLFVVFIVPSNLPVAGQEPSDIAEEVSRLREIVARYAFRSFNERTARYEGCDLPEEDKNDIAQVIDRLGSGFGPLTSGAPAIDIYKSPLSNLRAIFASLSMGYYKTRSGEYAGCAIPEEDMQAIKQLLDVIESKTQRVVPRVAPSSSRVKSPVPRETETRNRTTAPGFEIIQKKIENLTELSAWLNATTKNQRLSAIVPIGENVSVFIFEVLPRVERFSYSFHHINGPPTESELTQTIAANERTVFVGVHRYGASQYFAPIGGSIIVLRK